MASHGEAVAAKSKLAGYDRPFDSGAGYDSENKLFVGNLSWTVDDESLGAKFSNLHGKVLDAKDFDGRQMRVNLAGDKSPLRTCEF
ncbi:unnamed protein product [Sphagnum tenellum]